MKQIMMVLVILCSSAMLSGCFCDSGCGGGSSDYSYSYSSCCGATTNCCGAGGW